MQFRDQFVVHPINYTLNYIQHDHRVLCFIFSFFQPVSIQDPFPFCILHKLCVSFLVKLNKRQRRELQHLMPCDLIWITNNNSIVTVGRGKRKLGQMRTVSLVKACYYWLSLCGGFAAIQPDIDIKSIRYPNKKVTRPFVGVKFSPRHTDWTTSCSCFLLLLLPQLPPPQSNFAIISISIKCPALHNSQAQLLVFGGAEEETRLQSDTQPKWRLMTVTWSTLSFAP